MKILVFLENSEAREVTVFFLQEKFKIGTEISISVDKTIALLSDPKRDFSTVLCDNPKSVEKLITFAVKHNIVLNVFFVTDNPNVKASLPKATGWVILVSRGNMISSLETKLQKVFGELRASELAEDRYCKINLNLLLLASPIKGDLYVKLSDTKLVKILSEGALFQKAEYGYFHNQKGLEAFYFKQDRCTAFAQKIHEEILKAQGYTGPKVVDPNDATKKTEKRDVLAEKEKKLAELRAKTAQQEIERAQRIKAEAEARERELAITRAKEKARHEANALIREQNLAERKKQAQELEAIRQKELEAKRQAMAEKRDHEAQERQKRAHELEEQRAKEHEVKRNLLEGKKDFESPEAIEMMKQVERDLGLEVEALHEMSLQLGFTPEVQEQTKKAVVSTIQAVRNTPRLTLLWTRLQAENQKYISSHSLLLSYLSCGLASQMEWKSDTTYQKLILASFLHDIALRNHELAAVQTLDELNHNPKFTEEERKAYLGHPDLASTITRSFSEIPADVDSIVAQHHERPDGSGFPRGLTHARIGPLSAVFIVAHDLVCHLLSSKNRDLSSFEEFIEKKRSEYVFGNFKKVLTLVKKIKT